MILNNSRVQSIKKYIDGSSQDNYNFDFAPKNAHDVELLTYAKNDLSYLLSELNEMYYKLDEAENEYTRKRDQLDSYEIALEFNLKSKKKLLSDNVLLELDNDYLINALKRIERICENEGEKPNNDLLKVKEIVTEALEGVE